MLFIVNVHIDLLNECLQFSENLKLYKQMFTTARFYAIYIGVTLVMPFLESCLEFLIMMQCRNLYFKSGDFIE